MIRGGRGEQSQTTAEQEADHGHQTKDRRACNSIGGFCQRKRRPFPPPPETAQLGNELTNVKQLGLGENVERAETETEQIVAIWGRCGGEKESGES